MAGQVILYLFKDSHSQAGLAVNRYFKELGLAGKKVKTKSSKKVIKSPEKVP